MQLATSVACCFEGIGWAGDWTRNQLRAVQGYFLSLVPLVVRSTWANVYI